MMNKINKDPVAYANSITIKKLVSVLQKLHDEYVEKEGNTEVSDDTYDTMVDVLRERDPTNPYLFEVNVSSTNETDVKLFCPMPSLDKIKPAQKTFEPWISKFKGPYVVMDKLDGTSIQIYKNDEGVVDLFTKKGTDIGTSKKHLLEYLVSKKTLNAIPKNTCIRGELVVSKEDFQSIKTFADVKNERSVIGCITSVKTMDTRIAKKGQFIAYNILSPRYTQVEQLDKLKSWGFKTVWNTVIDKIKKEYDLIEILKKRTIDSEFVVDGIVITDNSQVYEHTSQMPLHSIAFKMNNEEDMKNVVVKKVEWNPTMYGYLQPKVKFDKVILKGDVSVDTATAHNAKYIYDNKIGVGTIIKIVRSGDVIPYIVDVVKPSDKPDMPEMDYEWTSTKVDIYVKNPTKSIKRLINIAKNIHFFKEIGVKYLGEGIITKLYDNGYETVISIIIAANDKDPNMYLIEGLGKTMVNKIYGVIDTVMNDIKMPDFMAGTLFFGEGIGSKKIKKVLDVYSDIVLPDNDKYSDTDELTEMLLEVDGFQEKSAIKFANGLNQFHSFVKEIFKNTSYTLTKKSVTKVKNDIFKDKKIVITGFRDAKITEFIESNGGQVMSSVSKNTSLVIYVKSDKESSKLEKATQLQIPTIEKTDFEKKYNISQN